MASKRTTRTGSARKKAHAKRSPARAARTARRADVLAILKDDHDRVKKLFRRFERMKDGDAQMSQLVEQACRELEIHAMLEEELFYPRIRERIRESDLVEEAEVEHESAKHLIHQLKRLDAEDPKYAATFAVLAEYVQHHVREEENEIFPQVRRARIDLVAMGEELQARRQELLESGEFATVGAPGGVDREGLTRRDRDATQYRDVARH